METSIQKHFQKILPSPIFECLVHLESQVEKKYFTSWSLANKNFQISAFWDDEYLPQNRPLNLANSIHPVFDLASLTKPLFLNLILREKHGDRFVEFIKTPLTSALQKKDFKNVTLYDYFKTHPHLCLDSFLSHSSGLAPWCWMGRALSSHDAKNEITNDIVKNKSSVSKNTVYSDLNYYVLARILEEFDHNTDWKKSLDQLNNSLGTRFFHASLNPEKSAHAMPYFPYKTTLQKESAFFEEFGPAHDTNANILASLGAGQNIVSGHAGLFGSVCDVAKAVQYLSQTQNNFLESNKMLSQDRFVWGLDTPQSPDSQAGIQNWEKHKGHVFGHLGYTGTSFWFYSPTKTRAESDFHVLLTNRTAQRSSLSLKGKRIFTISQTAGSSSHYFIHEHGKIEEISQEKTFDDIAACCAKSKCTWDSSVMRVIPDISQTRKWIGNRLWII